MSSSRALFSLAIITSKHLLRRLREVKDFRATTGLACDTVVSPRSSPLAGDVTKET